MTFVPPDCTDQLFVLCLDFVSRPLVSCTSERLRMAVNSLSSEVYKAALIQKLSQNMWILQLQVKSRGQVDLSARLGHWISGQQTTTLSQESYTQLWDCVYHVSLVTVSRLQCDRLRYFPMFRSNFNVFDLSVVQKLPLFYIKMMSINRCVARIFQRGGGGGGAPHGHPRTPPPLATPLIKRPKFNGTPPLQPRFSMIYVWVHSKSSS